MTSTDSLFMRVFGLLMAFHLVVLVAEGDWWMRILLVVIVGCWAFLALWMLVRFDELRDLRASPHRRLLAAYVVMMVISSGMAVLLHDWRGRLGAATLIATVTLLVWRELNPHRVSPPA